MTSSSGSIGESLLTGLQQALDFANGTGDAVLAALS
jgi:hypothetical protein